MSDGSRCLPISWNTHSPGCRARRIPGPTDSEATRSAVTVLNVVFEYGDRIVLARIIIQIASGAFVSIVGPSGCGKSTFLRMVLGQERPTRGTLLLDGAPMPDEPGPDRGVVF